MSTLQEIEAAALRLSQKDRLYLADKILGSLPPPPEATESDEILVEAIRRDAELESGQICPLTEIASRAPRDAKLRDLPKETIDTWIARDEAEMSGLRHISPSG